jgi:acyl carrier protein
MTNVEQRVAACFSNVIPGIEESQIPSSSTASLAAWDSVAHITLLSAISEEFGVEFSPDEFDELTSYLLIVDCLENRHG